MHRISFFNLAVLCLFQRTFEVSGRSIVLPSSNLLRVQVSRSSTTTALFTRGGSQQSSEETSSGRKRRKRSSTRTRKSRSRQKKSSGEISQAISDDPAEMMGDAIRARSSELLKDDLTHLRNNPSGRSAFTSISYAIGTSDRQRQREDQQKNDMDEGGGVEPPANAVIANYFLKSHGGAHGVQSLTSLCAVLFGIGTYFVPSANLGLKIRLVQRTLICALAKHLSGFLAVATMSADSIPEVGWKQTRRRIEALVLDPVAQYLFYCALLIVWVNGAVSASSAANTVVMQGLLEAKSDTITFPWWLQDDKWRPLCLTCIVIPILVREVVSTAWVVSDVLVLYYLSKAADASPAVLKAGKSMVDSIMSLLLTPKIWRSADAAQKQKLLAKLVGRISLGFEIGTCLIMVLDGIRAFVDFSVAPVTSRPSILSVAKRVICARLIINFMLVRRKKVYELVTEIRGGALHVPGRVLDCLLEPSKALGLEDHFKTGTEDEPKTFAKWVAVLSGF